MKEIEAAFDGITTDIAYAYTDGSTDPKSRSLNSGCSIFITDATHNAVWSGGMVVRADGNNFIPELAAAACVIKALPRKTRLTMRIDSLATIGVPWGTFGYPKEGESALLGDHG